METERRSRGADCDGSIGLPCIKEPFQISLHRQLHRRTRIARVEKEFR